MNEGWRRVRKQEETYFIPPALIEQPFAVLTIRSETTTRFQIWTKFITESLLQGILHTLAPETWQLEEGRFFRPTMKMFYMTMAIYIRVQGNYKVPHVCHRNQRPLREAIEEARRHFTDAHPNLPAICRHYVEKLLAHFLIDHTYIEYLSENFQSIVRSLGESVAGDGKLFHFTGNTAYIIQVPSKPAKIGSWIYQLAATLGNGLPFMVYMRMMAVQPFLGESAL